MFEEAQAKWAESLLLLGCEALCDVSCVEFGRVVSQVSMDNLVWPYRRTVRKGVYVNIFLRLELWFERLTLRFSVGFGEVLV